MLRLFLLLALVSCGKDPSSSASKASTNASKAPGTSPANVIECGKSPECSGACKQEVDSCRSDCYSAHTGKPALQHSCSEGCSTELFKCITDSCLEICSKQSATVEETETCMAQCT